MAKKSVYITESVHQELSSFCADRGLKLSFITDQALRQFLDNRKQAEARELESATQNA